MFVNLPKRWVILERERIPRDPLDMGMDKGNSSFLVILDPLAKFQPKVGILDEGSLRFQES